MTARLQKCLDLARGMGGLRNFSGGTRAILADVHRRDHAVDAALRVPDSTGRGAVIAAMRLLEIARAHMVEVERNLANAFSIDRGQPAVMAANRSLGLDLGGAAIIGPVLRNVLCSAFEDTQYAGKEQLAQVLAAKLIDAARPDISTWPVNVLLNSLT